MDLNNNDINSVNDTSLNIYYNKPNVQILDSADTVRISDSANTTAINGLTLTVDKFNISGIAHCYENVIDYSRNSLDHLPPEKIKLMKELISKEQELRKRMSEVFAGEDTEPEEKITPKKRERIKLKF